MLGGWQVTGIGQLQTGGPLFFDSNYIYRGDPNAVAISGKPDIDLGSIPAASKSNGPAMGSELPDRPRVFPGAQGQGLNLSDLSVIKHFDITETRPLQLRGEFLNAFNHAQSNNPERNDRPTRTSARPPARESAAEYSDRSAAGVLALGY